MSQAHLYGQSLSGAWVPLKVTDDGRLSAGAGDSGLPSGIDTAITNWSYVAASGGVTDANDVTLVTAPGAGRSNYLTALQLMNSSATATEVVIKTGSTVLWRVRLGASMTAPVQIMFPRPIVGGNNTALTAACITTATVTYINAQGYQDASIVQISALLTPQEEVFDQAGDQVFDAASDPIYLN